MDLFKTIEIKMAKVKEGKFHQSIRIYLKDPKNFLELKKKILYLDFAFNYARETGAEFAFSFLINTKTPQKFIKHWTTGSSRLTPEEEKLKQATLNDCLSPLPEGKFQIMVQ